MAHRARTAKKGAREAQFLAALEQTGNVSRACVLSKFPRRSAYDLRDADEAFKKAWDATLDRAADLLEEEARRRAYQGVKKPVFQGGKLVGHVQEYSDTLLIFLLKGNKPAKFGDRTTIAGDKNNPIPLRHDIDSTELIAKIVGAASKPKE